MYYVIFITLLIVGGGAVCYGWCNDKPDNHKALAIFFLGTVLVGICSIAVGIKLALANIHF